MKWIIRRLVNWAFGLDFLMEIIILNQAKENLASSISDSVSWTSLQINQIKREMDAIRKSSQR